MKPNGSNISLTPYDDIFSTEETRQGTAAEQIQKLPLSDLVAFKDHPFRVVDDDRMMETVESVKEYGVLVPIIARTNTVAADGTKLDEVWQANDGCANVISQRAPFGAPVNELGVAPSAAAAAKAQKGVYNVLPTVRATHMWPIGDFIKPRMEGLLYLQKLLEMVNALA